MTLPYVTVGELQNSTLGVDWSSVPRKGASPIENYLALYALAQEASGMVDAYVRFSLTGKRYQEYDIADAGSRKAQVTRNGLLTFHADALPVVLVKSFGYQYLVRGATSTVVPLAEVLIGGGRKELITHVFDYFARYYEFPLRIDVEYVAGYAHTFLTAPTPAASPTLPVDDATGMVAGKVLTIYDSPGRSENVVVASSWTPAEGAANLPLVSPTVFAHTPVAPDPSDPGVFPVVIPVSCVPGDVKWACVLTCKTIVEQRGTTALVMGRAGAVASQNLPGKEELVYGSLPLSAAETLEYYRRIL